MDYVFNGTVGALAVITKASQADLPLQLEIPVVANDMIEVWTSFNATGSFPWNIQGVAQTPITTLSSVAFFCQSTQEQSYTNLSCVVANSGGTLTLGFGMAPIGTVTLSNLVMVARKVGVVGTKPAPPTGTVWFDPQNWAETIADLQGRTQNWVPGYQVQYAVSFYNSFGESATGPWCDLIQGEPWALPTLTGIPVGQPVVTVGRNIYRQFKGSTPQLVGTIANNTDTRWLDASM